MLEIGGVEDAGRQDRDRHVLVVRHQRAQRRQQLARIMLDGAHAHGAEHAGKGPAHHIAIGEHVRDAGGHAQIILEHDEVARLVAHQIAAADIDIGAVRHRDAAHLAQIMARAIDHGARHDAVLQHTSVAIDVAQEKIERLDALLEAGLDARPFGRGDDARQQIGRDDALGRLVIGIDGEGDALMQEGELAGLLAAMQLLGRQSGQPHIERRVMLSHETCVREHLVIGGAQRVIGVRGDMARAPGCRGGLPLGRLGVGQRLMLHARSMGGDAPPPSSERLGQRRFSGPVGSEKPARRRPIAPPLPPSGYGPVAG